MKKLLLITLLVYGANANIILNHFLSLNGSKSDTIYHKEFSKSYIEKFRLSAQYSDFDKDSLDDEYEVRIYLKKPSQIEIEKRLHDLTKEQIKILDKEFKESILKNRLILVLNAYFKKKLYKSLKKEIELDKKLLNFLIKETNEVLDIYNISKLKEQIEYKELLYLDEKRAYNYLLEEIKKVVNKDLQKIDIAIDKLSLKKIDIDYNLIDKISLKKEIIKLNILKEEIELQKRSNSFTLSSFDVGYNNRSLFVAFNIEYTLPKSNSLDNIKDSLTLINAKNRYNLVKKQKTHQAISLKDEILTLQNRVNFFKNRLKNRNFSHSYLHLRDKDLKIVFELKKREFELNKKILENEHRLYKRLIDFLFLTDKLTKRSIFNSI